MSVATDDIRYKARCFKCGKPLGDWSLKLPEDMRFCYDHWHFNLGKETKTFSVK